MNAPILAISHANTPTIEDSIAMHASHFSTLTNKISQEDWKEFLSSTSISNDPMNLEHLFEYISDYAEFIDSIERVRVIVSSLVYT